MKKIVFTIIQIMIGLTLASCDKLEEKPRLSLVVPSTLQDLQGVLDNTDRLNANYCTLGEVSSDDYYLNESNYNSLSSLLDRKAHIWDRSMLNGLGFEADWFSSYEKILYANIVLDQLNEIAIEQRDQTEFRNIKGQALFHRANAYMMLANQYCKPYQAATAVLDLGLPLRLSADVNQPSKRATLQQTYDLIQSDLLEAKGLVSTTNTYKTRPGKAAVFGTLTRLYLSVKDYQKAFLNADSCLQLHSTLLNYNALSKTVDFPFVRLNGEVIYHSTLASKTILRAANAFVEPSLYSSYSDNDERKSLYFKANAGGYFFKGNYNGAETPLFSGIATDEMFLVRAECHARLGRTTLALEDLNKLLVTRFKEGSFVPISAGSPDEALMKILKERRKELIFRGLRWPDLRRLNQEPLTATTLYRKIGNINYTLHPNDNRYTFLLPDYVVVDGGIEQNPN
jgi:hypothetical protein